jgi:uncharacterized protein
MMKSLLFIAIAWTTIYAQSSVWKVQKEGYTLYLAGTIHLLRSQDYPLPKAYEIAFKDTSVVAFETDISALEDPATAMLMLKAFQSKHNLASSLSPKTFKRLDLACQDMGINIEHFNTFNPAMLLISLMKEKLHALGVDAQGVDEYYYQKALNHNKKVLALESIEAQISYLAQMGVGEEEAFVNYSLDELINIETDYLTMLSAWRSGDEAKLQSQFVDKMQKDSPQMAKLLLDRRNSDWLPQLEQYLSTKERELVLVGAAHLVGNNGLLHSLEKLGCKIEKVNDARINR